MKILQSTIRYYPALGGAEEYVRRISEGLAQRGHEIKVFTSDLKESVGTDRLKAGREMIGGIAVNRHRAFCLGFKKYMVMPTLLSNMLQARTEIIHGHCYMYFPLDVSALASFVKKIPLVVNPYLAELGPPSIAGRIYRRTVGRLIMNAEMVIAISQYEKHLIQQWGYCPKAMEIIPPGVDLKEFADVKHNIYQKYGLGKNDYIVLFVGRIDWMKGVDILIEAAPEILKRVPETKIVVVGPDFGMKRRLEYMVREKKLERNIVFLDALSRSDVISAFKNATVFVLPTRYEAFGIVLIEAMAAGLPVVASSCSAIPYVVEHGENGLLFPTNSYNDLAGCVIRLLRDTELRRKMGEAGYSEVRHKYDWQKNITRLEDLYRYLLR